MDDYMEEEQFLQLFSNDGNTNLHVHTNGTSVYSHDHVQSMVHPGVVPVREDVHQYLVDDITSWQTNHIAQNNYQPQFLPESSMRSSMSSAYRSSINSIFSQQQQSRSSVASTNTTWSNISQSSGAERVSAAHGNISNFPVALTHDRAEPQPSVLSQLRHHSNNQPNTSSTTCTSRPKRTRRLAASSPRYWCTSCHEPFREKYDWKRHEETYQERSCTYHCGLCPKTYFLDKDLIHHHRESHRCQTCVENRHVEHARRQRRTRTGWGCGFCLRWDGDWGERCKHVAWHFEKNGDVIEKWNQTKVILSLLQQPGVKEEWRALLERKGEANPSFGWSRKWAGRADGYIEGDKNPQLQDLLEFYTPKQNARAVVEWAWELGHQSPPPDPRERPLPPLPMDAPLPLLPSVPLEASPARRQNYIFDSTPLHFPTSSGTGFEHWGPLIDTIPEDTLLPDAMPLFDVHMDTTMHLR